MFLNLVDYEAWRALMQEKADLTLGNVFNLLFIAFSVGKSIFPTSTVIPYPIHCWISHSQNRLFHCHTQTHASLTTGGKTDMDLISWFISACLQLCNIFPSWKPTRFGVCFVFLRPNPSSCTVIIFTLSPVCVEINLIPTKKRGYALHFTSHSDSYT